jgi:hypothetical protein
MTIMTGMNSRKNKRRQLKYWVTIRLLGMHDQKMKQGERFLSPSGVAHWQLLKFEE